MRADHSKPWTRIIPTVIDPMVRPRHIHNQPIEHSELKEPEESSMATSVSYASGQSRGGEGKWLSKEPEDKNEFTRFRLGKTELIRRRRASHKSGKNAAPAQRLRLDYYSFKGAVIGDHFRIGYCRKSDSDAVTYVVECWCGWRFDAKVFRDLSQEYTKAQISSLRQSKDFVKEIDHGDKRWFIRAWKAPQSL